MPVKKYVPPPKEPYVEIQRVDRDRYRIRVLDPRPGQVPLADVRNVTGLDRAKRFGEKLLARYLELESYKQEVWTITKTGGGS